MFSKNISINNIKKTPKPVKKYDYINLNIFLETPYYEKILKFTKTIFNNYNEESQINFINNINELCIYNNSNKRRVASYFSKSNSININMNYKFAIFHELMHVSSTIYMNNTDFSGFSQKYGLFSIGNGLNEGYTQLLSERFFEESRKGISYPYHVITAKNLELLVGEKTLSNLYFNADLYGLINELKKYSDEESIINFLVSLDFLLKYLNYGDYFKVIGNLNQQALYNINIFLMNAFYNKIISKIKEDKENIDLYKKMLEEYIKDNLCKELNYGNSTYELASYDLIKKKNYKLYYIIKK